MSFNTNIDGRDAAIADRVLEQHWPFVVVIVVVFGVWLTKFLILNETLVLFGTLVLVLVLILGLDLDLRRDGVYPSLACY